jgi:hypothetical protein
VDSFGIRYLFHIKDLDAVVGGFATNNHEIVLGTNLAPLTNDRVLGQASEIDQFALFADLSKGCPI